MTLWMTFLIVVSGILTHENEDGPTLLLKYIPLVVQSSTIYTDELFNIYLVMIVGISRLIKCAEGEMRLK